MFVNFALPLVVAIQLLSVANCQIPCDEAYGTHCPEASGWEVGTCLKGVESGSLSADCLNYINLHESCKVDIDTHCTGKEFTGDLLVCLSDWTKPELLSAECSTALPKKEKKEKKLSEKEKKKAAARRKTRNEASKMARKLNAKNQNNKKKSSDDDDDDDSDEL